MNKDTELNQPLDAGAFDATRPEAIAIDQLPWDAQQEIDEEKAHQESLDRFQYSM